MFPNQIAKCLKKKMLRLPSLLILVSTWLGNDGQFYETTI